MTFMAIIMKFSFNHIYNIPIEKKREFLIFLFLTSPKINPLLYPQITNINDWNTSLNVPTDVGHMTGHFVDS